MRKRFVGFRHAMHIVALLDDAAAKIRSVVQFVGQLIGHTFFRVAAPGVAQDPADRQTGPAILGHFDRHLIVGSAYTAGFDFEQRLGVFDGLS